MFDYLVCDGIKYHHALYDILCTEIQWECSQTLILNYAYVHGISDEFTYIRLHVACNTGDIKGSIDWLIDWLIDYIIK